MNNKIFKNINIFFLTLVIYIVTTLPLRDIFAVFTVTDVRPGAVVNPFLSICFGPVASLACAIANFIADYISGYPNAVLIIGIPFQFLYGLISWLIWKKLTKNDEHSYRLNSVSKIVKFIFTMFVYGVVSAIGVSIIVRLNYGVPILDTAKFVFLNNFDMSVILGLPLMIFANIVVSGIHNEKIRKLSKNEVIILYTSVIEIVGLAIIAYATYSTYINAASETYEVWNNIFFYSAAFINIVLVITIVFLKILEGRD